MEQINSRIKKVKDGEAIIKEDTWPYYIYVLQDGKAKVLKNVDGRQVLIGILTKGDVFGEMGFLEETQRTASVVADGDGIVEMITRDTFEIETEKMPEFMRQVVIGMDRCHGIVVERLNKVSSKLDANEFQTGSATVSVALQMLWSSHVRLLKSCFNTTKGLEFIRK